VPSDAAVPYPVGLGQDPGYTDAAPVGAPLTFDWSQKATVQNQEVLAPFDWDLGRALAHQG
jgi:hypothetical protein